MTPYTLYHMYNRRAEAILFPANQILVMNGVSIFGRARLRLLFIRFGREQNVGKLGITNHLAADARFLSSAASALELLSQTEVHNYGY